MFLILELSFILSFFFFLSFFSVFFSKKIIIDLILDAILILWFFCFFILFFNLYYHTQSEIEYCYWLNIFALKLKWSFFCDNLVCLMVFFVTLIATFVILYSIDYMYFDPFFIKFISYLFLFTFFMLILVTGQHFLQLFLGWEGVGLCSYLLIGFWSTRVNAHKSAMKALIINRIGDIFLLIAFGYLFYFFRTLDMGIIFLLSNYFSEFFFLFFNIEVHLISIICWFLLIGAMGKSAQFGLHTWLPDAMEGPTPVSALIHAATMVTAGVFLILKCSFLFEYCDFLLILVFFFGGLMAIIASSIGLVQYDIKKIIAYSTCSQLGLMFLICGLSYYSLGFYHLLTHACFKALLFLVAGAIIHQLSDEQDSRKFGGLFLFLPFLYNILIIGSCALMGFPFLAGFYSKDLIIESVFFFDYEYSTFLQLFVLFITLCTCWYSMRLIVKTFYWFPNGFYRFYLNMHKVSFFIFIVLTLLAILSIFIGFLLSELFSISGNLFFVNNLFFLAIENFLIENEFLPFYLKILPTILSFFVCIFYLICIEYRFFNLKQFNVQKFWLRFRLLIGVPVDVIFSFDLYFLNRLWFFGDCLGFMYCRFWELYEIPLQKWFFDIVQNQLFAEYFLKQSFSYYYYYLDKGYLEIFGPRGISKIVERFSLEVLKLHSFFFDSYYFFIFFFFIYLIYF